MRDDLKVLFQFLNDELRLNSNSLSSFSDDYVVTILNKIDKDNAVEVDECKKNLLDFIDLTTGPSAIFLSSALYYLDKSERSIELLLNIAYRDREVLGLNNVYFVLQQCSAEVFLHAEIDTINLFKLRHRLYIWVIDQYSKVMSPLLTPIPYAKRRKGFVVVLTDQQIDYMHGPSKSSVDRCKTLIEKGYSVFLINTAEALTPIGTVPFIESGVGGYKEESLNFDHLEWKGVSIPYFQCEQNTPNPRTINELLNSIRNLSPEFIVSIGGTGILMGLVSQFIPSLCVGMCPSDLAISNCSFQTYSGIRDTHFKDQLSTLGLSDDSVIDAVFGSSIKPQAETHTRSELNISEESFLVAVVGGRLNIEADAKFMETLIRISQQNENVEFLFLGNYAFDENTSKKYGAFVHPIGMVGDILSYLKLCNLYINPIRRGGGTSCVEAMSMGLPVITTSFGDVAVNAGEDFWISDYQEYPNAVHKYVSDSDYYNSQSQKAIQRADKLLHAEQSFLETIETFKKRLSE